MKVLDFLFYYLTLWFEEHKQNLKWSTPLERAIYVLGIITICWIISFNEIIQMFFFKETIKSISTILIIVIGLGIMELYKYIYITKKRYELIVLPLHQYSYGKNKIGKISSIFFVFFSMMLPYFIFMIFS